MVKKIFFIQLLMGKITKYINWYLRDFNYEKKNKYSN